MHCPRCGQQQVSEEIRFCSRCGFPMGVVSELLAHGGFLPQLADWNKKNKKWLTRKNGLKFGLAWFLVMMFIVTPIFAILGADEILPCSGVLGFMGGILIMLFSWMFLPSETKNTALPEAYPNMNTTPQFLHESRTQTALPPQQTYPAQSYAPPANSWKAPDTGELTRPGSVTEGTTKLLNKDE